MLKTFLRGLSVLLPALVLSACVSSGNGIGGTGQSSATQTAQLGEPDTFNNTGPMGLNPEYRVGPQDLLQVEVFMNDDLKREIRVATGGQISLPLIGTLMAAGKTVNELERDIAQAYSKTYLQNPQISVFVKEFASQRVTIEGVVKKPGIYPITGKTSLIQAIALGGGLDDLASETNVAVFRVIDGQRNVAVFNLHDIRTGKAPDPQIYGNDVVVVDKSVVRSVFKRFVEVIPVFNVFRYY